MRFFEKPLIWEQFNKDFGKKKKKITKSPNSAKAPDTISNKIDWNTLFRYHGIRYRVQCIIIWNIEMSWVVVRYYCNCCKSKKYNFNCFKRWLMTFNKRLQMFLNYIFFLLNFEFITETLYNIYIIYIYFIIYIYSSL